MPNSGRAREVVPREHLNEKQRQRLIEHPLQGSNNGNLGKNDVNKAATEFEGSRCQILRVWKRYEQQKATSTSATGGYRIMSAKASTRRRY